MRKSLIVVVVAFSACFGPKRLTDPVHHSARRSQQLMVLAAGEARHIPDADMRLTRQLNIANEILGQYGKDGAVEALRQATDTLNTVGGKLTGHALLAGWVSVAQLSRRASDSTLATEAVSRAVTELERIPDPAERCDYVMGVAEELSHTVDAPSAVALLTKSGDWAASIMAESTRRDARLAFASALFNLEDYDAGAGVLRKEGDPLWSSDSMVRLASPNAYYAVAQRRGNGVPVAQYAVDAEAKEPAAAAPVTTQPYGKQLDFDSVFEGRTQSSAVKR